MTYPQTTADGRIVWACCTSTIGPKCQHVRGYERCPLCRVNVRLDSHTPGDADCRELTVERRVKSE